MGHRAPRRPRWRQAALDGLVTAGAQVDGGGAWWGRQTGCCNARWLAGCAKRAGHVCVIEGARALDGAPGAATHAVEAGRAGLVGEGRGACTWWRRPGGLRLCLSNAAAGVEARRHCPAVGPGRAEQASV